MAKGLRLAVGAVCLWALLAGSGLANQINSQAESNIAPADPFISPGNLATPSSFTCATIDSGAAGDLAWYVAATEIGGVVATAHGLCLGQGSTAPTFLTMAADTVLHGKGTSVDPEALAVPNCGDTGGNHLNYSTSTHTLTCGTSGLATPVSPANGGTGVASPTVHDLLVAEGASNFALVALATDNLLQGTTGADPAGTAIPNCGDSSHGLAYSTSTHTFSCQTITGAGSTGTVNAAAQYDAPYYSAAGSSNILSGAAISGLQLDSTSGAPAAYAGAACTNQFLSALSAAGAGTCTTDTLAGAQHANQGTTTTLLHGNAAGNPSWAGVSLANDTAANQGTATTLLHGNAAGQPSFAAVGLTTDVTGTLPVANGGTSLATLTAHAVYAGNTTSAPTAIGPDSSTGKVLTSQGSSTDPAFLSRPYDLAGFDFGAPTASGHLEATCQRTVNFPANFTSSTYPQTTSQSSCLTAPAETDGYLIKVNGTEIGAVCLSTSCSAAGAGVTLCTGSGCTTSCSGGDSSTKSCTAGQQISVVAPATVSGTGVTIGLAGSTP